MNSEMGFSSKPRRLMALIGRPHDDRRGARHWARISRRTLLRDNRLGDRDHLSVELAFGYAELRRPNLLRGTQSEKRHPCAARLDDDDSSFGHCRADHPQDFARDRAVRIKVVQQPAAAPSSVVCRSWSTLGPSGMIVRTPRHHTSAALGGMLAKV